MATPIAIVYYNLLYAVQRALDLGIAAFFITANPEAYVKLRPLTAYHMPAAMGFLSYDVNPQKPNISADVFMQSIYALYSRYAAACDYCDCVRAGNSCTIYPAILETLKVPPSQSVTFRLVEGLIIYRGQYFDSVIGSPQRSGYRSKATKALGEADMVPSHIGTQSGSPLVTVADKCRSLELSCVVQYSGNQISVDLRRVICGYIGMKWTSPCPHPTSDRLDKTRHNAISTSVACPGADGRIGIAMTRHSPTSQLLCCSSSEYQAVIQKDCCLNCAIDQLEAGKETRIVIIVG